MNISDYLEKGPVEDIPLKKETLDQIIHWQKFVEKIISLGKDIPRFPVWSMEFGATYPYLDKATNGYTVNQLNQSKGKYGIQINAENQKELEKFLPKYSLSSQDVFPKWKKSYIGSNRDFYSDNKEWIEDWKKSLFSWKLSHQKFEWNCGPDANPSFKDKIIQFRPSGIRVKNMDRFPALVLSITQVPIIYDKHKRGGAGFRYITKREAANLQSMPVENFQILSNNVSAYKAFGNAVNIKVVEAVVNSVIKNSSSTEIKVEIELNEK